MMHGLFRTIAASLALFCAVAPNLGAASAKPTPPSANEAASCLDTAMARLGISLDMETAPELLQDVLANDMHLANLPSALARVDDKLHEAQSLRPMLEEVRGSIIAKHPAISEFVCRAVASGLIAPLKDTKMVIRTIHHMYLLESIIGGMYSDHLFMAEVARHFVSERQRLGARGDFLGSSIDIARATGDLFFVAKAKTIDGVFKRFETIRGDNYLADSEAAGSKLCLILNITEAVVTDSLEGRRNNALVGIGLSLNPLERVTLDGDERVLHYELSQDWTSLYETWNLAFITGKMDNLQVLFPKLLIPRVINAPANEYMFNRTLALYTGINFYLLNKLAKKPAVVLPRSQELARLWGEINLKYAKAYVRDENGVELESFGGRLKTGVLKTGLEILDVIQNPFTGVPRVCI